MSYPGAPASGGNWQPQQPGGVPMMTARPPKQGAGPSGAYPPPITGAPQQHYQQQPQQHYQATPAMGGGFGNNGGRLKTHSFAHKTEETTSSYDNGVGAGCYASMLGLWGDFCGLFGSIPCLCCFSPYTAVSQGNVGIVTRFGKYMRTVDPGLHYVNLGTESMRIIDVRMQLTDIPRQVTVTKDNVTANIDSVLYWQITDPFCATFMVGKIENAIMERTMTTLRQVIGSHTLQDAICSRDTLGQQIEDLIQPVAASWGARIESILIKDIQFSRDLQESLSAVAKQKRLAESKVISAQGEVDAAKLMREASDILNTPAAMQIRYLETVKAMSAHDMSAKVIFMPPNAEIMAEMQQQGKSVMRGQL